MGPAQAEPGRLCRSIRVEEMGEALPVLCGRDARAPGWASSHDVGISRSRYRRCIRARLVIEGGPSLFVFIRVHWWFVFKNDWQFLPRMIRPPGRGPDLFEGLRRDRQDALRVDQIALHSLTLHSSQFTQARRRPIRRGGSQVAKQGCSRKDSRQFRLSLRPEWADGAFLGPHRPCIRPPPVARPAGGSSNSIRWDCWGREIRRRRPGGPGRSA